MISSYELKCDTWKVVAEKLRRTDAVLEALDKVVFREAVALMTKEVRDEYPKE